MAWMDESFKKDKRFLELQLKRGKMKIQEVNAILSSLPDASPKAEIMHYGESNPEPSKESGNSSQPGKEG